MNATETSAWLLGAVLLTGCEAVPTDVAGASASASAPTRYCAREARTGSNLLVKECAAAQSDTERQQAIENMRVKNPSTSTVRSSGGG